MRTLIVALVVLVCLFSGCMQHTNAREVEALLRDRLEPGASRAQIESVLTDLEITHSFNDFNRRYNGIVRNPNGSNYHAVVIHIYIDATGNMTHMEIRDSYTLI